MCATSPTRRALSQRTDVNAVLAELGVDAEGEPGRLLEVWNKADLLDAATRSAGSRTRRRAIRRILPGLGRDRRGPRDAARRDRDAGSIARRDTIEIALQPEEGSLSNWIYENCEVVERSELGDGVTALRIRVAPEKRDRLARLAGAGAAQARGGIGI